ncbi:MAG TPA: hypothetical protein VFB99_22770 [Vicinamibacterales bacterium]|nr:hypothetical protein [Vicinamibacterales bacterium]
MADEMDWGGPWLQAAVFCEKVLTERDGVVSLIRVVDRFIFTATGAAAPEKMPESTFQVTGMLMFKSGFAKGSHDVKLALTTPSGVRMPEQTISMFLEGDDRGMNLGFSLNLAAKEEGLYWMDVRVRDRLFTRMPLRILYQRIQGAGPARPG